MRVCGEGQDCDWRTELSWFFCGIGEQSWVDPSAAWENRVVAMLQYYSSSCLSSVFITIHLLALLVIKLYCITWRNLSSGSTVNLVPCIIWLWLVYCHSLCIREQSWNYALLLVIITLVIRLQCYSSSCLTSAFSTMHLLALAHHRASLRFINWLVIRLYHEYSTMCHLALACLLWFTAH